MNLLDKICREVSDSVWSVTDRHLFDPVCKSTDPHLRDIARDSVWFSVHAPVFTSVYGPVTSKLEQLTHEPKP